MTTTNSDKPLILVTGSTGLIGTRLVHALAKDYRIVGLDIKEPEESWPGTAWKRCDLTDSDATDAALIEIRNEYGGDVACVIHLAAYYDFSGEPSPLYTELTVHGTRRLLDGLKKFDRVGQFIFSSSLLVMKPVDDEQKRLTERSATQAEWDYPESKLEAERVLRDHHGDMPVVILRLAGAYDEDCRSLPISQQIRRIHEKQPESYVFPGDTGHGQPFIHLDDVTSGVREVLAHRDELDATETFLVAEPEVMSYGELQNALGELIHGKEWPTVRIPKTVAKAGAAVKEKVSSGEDFIKPWMVDLADDHYPVEMRRAQERLDWAPTHVLRKILPEMIARLKRDPQRWYEMNNLEMPAELKSD